MPSWNGLLLGFWGWGGVIDFKLVGLNPMITR